MTASITSGAPATNALGIQDKSTRALVPEAEALPTHLAKVYIYAKKGPLDAQLVGGNARSNMYGEASFDMRQKWATHTTVLSNLLTAKGNAQMIQRLKPADAGPNASIRIYADVLPTQIDLYERNPDGSIKINNSGVPITTGTKTAGYKVKFVVSQVMTDTDGDSDFGAATQVAGDQTDVLTTTQSVRYPLMDLEAPDFGEYGNNNGVRLWAPTVNSSMPIDDRLLTNEKAYPFRIACVSRTSELTTPQIVETTSAEQFLDVCFKPNVIDSTTDTLKYIGDVFLDAYQDLESKNLPPKWGPFGRFKLYDENVAELLDLFYTAEKAHINSFSDFVDEAGEEYRFNLISGMSSSGVPYASYQIVTGAADSVRFSESATVFAKGGSDGTMSDALLGGLVAEEVVKYADINSGLQNNARYPESIIYDSGFPLDTKYALCSFIAARKDTAVVLSTFDVDGPRMTASQESALAIALRTRLQMYPESEFFGTPTVRGMVIGRNGKMLNNQYRKRLPLTLEIASKAAAYMGASNGEWKAGFAFDEDPLNQVDMFVDVNVTFTPVAVRNKDWANSLNWVENYTRRGLFFPALKTVYDNDTSVLNSFFTMMACVELEKVGERARRKYSGISSLTNGQLIERVNKFVLDNTAGRFDKRFTIVPDAYFTEADIARGYSWCLPIKIYAPNMKTVMTLSIQSYRISDLAE